MSLFSISLVFFLLLSLEFLYFKIADHFNIIDRPNNRSSHNLNTIRGGGIVFTMCLLVYIPFFGLQNPFFLMGALIISIISFVDDINPVSNKIRLLFHLTAIALLFYQVGAFHLPIYIVVISAIIAIGTINAVNFMDGINGITASYAFVGLVTLWYINKYVINFTREDLIITVVLAVLVFGFFNFRTKAKCFAGDVGSVGIAFILVFFVVQVVVLTGDLVYILLFLVYGLDTITTILFRLYRRENIFEAHRSHYYQYLSNEKKIPHIYVATIYATFQLIINIVAVLFLKNLVVLMVCFVIGCFIAFVGLRLLTEGSERLLKQLS